MGGYPLDQHPLLIILERIWKHPVTTKSDYAREHADLLAMAAVLGYITNAETPGPNIQEFGRIWKVTPAGLSYLWESIHNE